MVDKKQNKSYNVQLNYNLTKRTQHTQISANNEGKEMKEGTRNN